MYTPGGGVATAAMGAGGATAAAGSGTDATSAAGAVTGSTGFGGAGFSQPRRAFEAAGARGAVHNQRMRHDEHNSDSTQHAMLKDLADKTEHKHTHTHARTHTHTRTRTHTHTRTHTRTYARTHARTSPINKMGARHGKHNVTQ